MENSRSSLTSISTSKSSSRSNGVRESYSQPMSAPVTRRPTNVELSRVETSHLQYQSTVGSGKDRVPKEQWLSMGLEKEYPPDLPGQDKYIVEFAGEDDPMHPHNWPTSKK